MCGIIAILRRRSRRSPEELGPLVAELAAALEEIGVEPGDPSLARRLERTAARLGSVDRRLTAVAGIRALVADREAEEALRDGVAKTRERLTALEDALDRSPVDSREVEALNAGIVALRDVVFSLERDRLDGAVAVRELASGLDGGAAVTALHSVHQALRALDRLEVRGRDSAGLVVVLRGVELDPRSPDVAEQLASRSDSLLRHRSVRWVEPRGEESGGIWMFVYKRAAEIGELGDNVRFLRSAIRDDELLHLALAGERVEATVLGHTRWASVGMISEANAHPLDERSEASAGLPVVAALNGDVDNYADLKASGGLRFSDAITTDAKVIPAMVSAAVERGLAASEAFRETVASFEGSVAVAGLDLTASDRLWLAVAGSGQGLYVGLDEDDDAGGEGTFVVASEPYGLVEQTSRYLRLDGTRGGEVVELDATAAGSLEGLERRGYDGAEHPVSSEEVVRADLTTRDIDRGTAAHYLRKEIDESPRSFAKTLRGKILGPEGARRVELGPETLPPGLCERLEDGRIRRIVVIGQGTAAVAGAAVAESIERAIESPSVAGGRPVPSVRSLCATELSGFGLRDDMSDVLVIAVSQSGTTTDTNRTVDLARSRGAAVVAIVNRRHSDLVSKADGVLYTSDGRDVEMSVASTKAFYAQVAAGVLLASALADRLLGERSGGRERQALLDALIRLPEAMRRTIDGCSPEIARLARELAPGKRYWALVGNGPNRIAAQEVRIKLSELCYKSIACDATEDKKHIDLSSEPLILICAAGLAGSTADDVAKEVAIYRAHKATPIVVCSEGDSRFAASAGRIEVPRVHPFLDFVLSALAGHLFGYFAAQAIDAQALPVRQIRGAIESAVDRWPAAGGVSEPLEALADAVAEPARAFARGVAEGWYDGHLEASTALGLWRLLNVLERPGGLDAYAREWGRPALPAAFLEDLAAAATRAIDELTRPIDAIKHQAKTVTVGISRSDEAFVSAPLVRALLDTGVDRAGLSYADLRTLAALDPLVERVLGFTRYRIEGDPRADGCILRVVGVGGIARDLRSRTRDNPALKGTKRRVAEDGRLLVARGQSDGRTFVLVPELDGGRARGLALLHLRFAKEVAAAVLRDALAAYRDRYALLRDLIMETESGFADELLTAVPVVDLLTAPPEEVVRRWRGTVRADEIGARPGRRERTRTP